MNPFKLVKALKGGVGKDELAELCAAAGMDLTFEEVPAAASSFTALGASASLPGAKLSELRGKTKDGGALHALLVLNQLLTAVSAVTKIPLSAQPL